MCAYSETSVIRDICCGREVLFETCVTMKFVDDDDDDNGDVVTSKLVMLRM